MSSEAAVERRWGMVLTHRRETTGREESAALGPRRGEGLGFRL